MLTLWSVSSSPEMALRQHMTQFQHMRSRNLWNTGFKYTELNFEMASD